MWRTEAQQRAALAILISVVLHFMLVVWLRGVSLATAPPPSPRILTAQLRAAEPVAAPPSLPTTQPEALPDLPRENLRLSTKAPARKPQLREAPSPPVQAPAPSSPGVSLAEALESAPLVQAEVFDPAMIGRYRAALVFEMSRRRFYPLMARAKNQTGNVEMRIDFSGGRLVNIVVVRSSGHTTLDEGAVELAREAYRETVMPPPLREQSFSLERVQVDYDLETMLR